MNKPKHTMLPKRLVSLTSVLVVLLSSVATGSSEDKPVEPPKWVSSAAAGFTLTSGNSETMLATLSGATGRKWDQNELSLGIEGAYGKNKDQGTGETSTTTESLRGFSQYNRLFTERWYAYARVEGLHDGIAAIRYRVTLSPGAGYYLIKQTNTDLAVELGPGYVIQQLGSFHTNYQNESFATLRVGEKFHLKLNEHVRIWQTAEWLPKLDDFSNYIINAEIGIEADLSKDKRLALRSYLQDTYNSVPAEGRKNNDMKLVTALAYKF